MLALACVGGCGLPPHDVSVADAGSPRTDARGSGGAAGGDDPGPDAALPVPAPGARRLLDGPARLVGRLPDAALSKNGRYVAATLSLSGKHSLYLVDLDGQEPPRLVTQNLGADPADTAWDGDVLVIAASRRSPSSAAFVGDIVLLHPSWTHVQRTVTATGLACDVSPAGDAVACVQGQDTDLQTYNLAFAPVDGVSESRVALARQYYDERQSYSFQWTPDGSAYVVSGRASEAQPERITVHAPDTGALLAVIDEGSLPRVSPNSRQVAYLASVRPNADGLLLGNLRLAALDGGSPSLTLATDIASAFFLDNGALAAAANVKGGVVDLWRVDASGATAPRTLAAGVNGLAALARDPVRLAVVRGSTLRVVDGDGALLCSRAFEPPLGVAAARFTLGARSLVYADSAEIFLGIGAGKLLDLESCALHALPELLRWSELAGDELLLASTANGSTGTLYRADPRLGAARVVQDLASLPFAYAPSRDTLVFALEEGPDAGLYALSLAAP